MFTAQEYHVLEGLSDSTEINESSDRSNSSDISYLVSAKMTRWADQYVVEQNTILNLYYEEEGRDIC